MKKLSTLTFLALTVFNLSGQAKTKTPDHLVFMVFDQMRPDYIDRFDLKNFKRLKKMGTNFPNAYVGHMGSLTIVSHSIMATGVEPKVLPWADNWTLDKSGIFGKPGEPQYTLTLTEEQLLKGLKTLPPETFLLKRFKEKTHKTVYSIGEKHYSTITLGGPYADSIVYMKKDQGVCTPTGVNVPEWISSNDRYKINCKDTYGTELSFYPLDGNRFYPGKDSFHMGGDVWVADAALTTMKKDPNWGAMMITFGAIDKFGHMLGETDVLNPLAYEPPMHLKDIAQVADQQLGRILDDLKRLFQFSWVRS